MAQSQTDACNSALQRVGATTILSISDNSPEARACSVAFDSNRRDELRRHIWNFAIKRVQLAPDAISPAFDYTNAFTLPSDCLRVLRPKDTQCDWMIEGRKVLSNNDTVLNLRYVSDVEDVSQWDATFYNVFATSLAYDICEKLTQSNQKKVNISQEYKEEVAHARLVDAIESGPEDAPDDTWLLSRL